MKLMDLKELIGDSIDRRKVGMARWHAEGTNCYRLFHGAGEGWPGFTLDRYDSLILLQTFREPLEPQWVREIESQLGATLSFNFDFVYNHRGVGYRDSFSPWHEPKPEALRERTCLEMGVRYAIRARHRGIDPWLFLDLRAGRRFLKSFAKNKSVLNLFAYTCGAGVCAAHSGASEVWNVDFATSSLKVGRENAHLNEIPFDRFRIIEDDCLPVVRQLAGMSPGGRYGKTPKFQRFDPKQFDVVFLDPPSWSQGAFGAVDIARDYPSLFKPAVLACRSGGTVIATHHLSSTRFEEWEQILKRCAEKAGRPLRKIDRLIPEEDFPSFDENPPLKIAVCEI